MKTTKLKIVFMGTPDFAVQSLQHIVASEFTVVAVVTAPDKPSGRGRKPTESAVKQYAISQNIPVLQPEYLKSEAFLSSLSILQADVFVVVAFRMLPKEVWQMPKLGTFNLHASLLPDYRGAAPINWAIINGETKTGVTTFLIDEKIDTGAVLFQEAVSIDTSDTFGSLYAKLSALGARLVLKTLEFMYAGKIEPKKQKETPLINEAPKLTPENTRIDWHQDAVSIHNKIRGLNPFPKAWCLLVSAQGELKVNILASRPDVENSTLKPGAIKTTKKQLWIGTQKGQLEVLQIQLPGKKIMPTSALLNGFQFDSVAYFT
ncbi:MAG: methionyl-tRNA formyltransferase [Flavobacteriaceae bacterium]|nr:methionyl-tRNA formyltransferase [Flavobacteriaceae bacterium]